MACAVWSKLSKLNFTAELFLVLQATSYFLLMAILPQFLLHQSCLEISNNATICDSLASSPTDIQQGSQRETSFWLSMVYIARLLPTCFTLMVWGAVVDRIGQHKAMLLPPTVTCLQALLFLACSFYPQSSRIYIPMISSLSCLHGDFPGANVVLASSYAALISKPSNRGKRITILQGAAMMTDVIAGFMSGFVLQELGYSFAFGCVAVIAVLNIFFVIFFAKPIIQLKKETADTKSLKSYLNPLKSFTRALKVVWRSEYRKNFIFITAAMFFNIAAARGSKFIVVLYITNSPFNFTPVMVGYYLAYVAFIRGSGAIFFSQLLTKLFKSDFLLLYLGLGSALLHYMLIGFSKSPLMLFLVSLLGATAFLAPPVFRGLVTKLVDNKDAGKALSVTETVGIVCSLLTSFVSTNVYRVTLDFNTGFIYFVLATFALIGLFITVVMHVCLERGVLSDPCKDKETAKAMLAVEESLKTEEEGTTLV